MKYVKMLGLAAVAAAALMAFLGAGTASATVLCKTTLTTGCAATGWHYPVGTTLHGTLEAGTTATLRSTSEAIVDTCTESTVHGTTTNTGGASETVDGKVATLTFGNCTSTTTVHQEQNGLLEVHHIAGTDNGTVTGTGFEVTINVGGVTCTYGAGGGTHLGVLTGDKGPKGEATMDIEAVVPKITGGFLCPTHAIWEAEYWITSPTPLIISAS